MFTGIIEDLGSIENIAHARDGAVVTIRTKLPLRAIAIGESIAVNGCCLTVTKKGPVSGAKRSEQASPRAASRLGTFSMDVSAESLRRTVLGALKPGDRVNLERCLTLDKLLGGHLVSGHVDGVGRIVAIDPEGDSRLFTFEVAAPQARYLIEKGSVAIDGISLTVFGIHASGEKRNERQGAARSATRGENQTSLRAASTFQVSLIPHTLKMTTLGFKRPGDAVNIESDMLVKYIERVAAPYLTNGRKPPGRSLARNASGAAGGASRRVRELRQESEERVKRQALAPTRG